MAQQQQTKPRITLQDERKGYVSIPTGDIQKVIQALAKAGEKSLAVQTMIRSRVWRNYAIQPEMYGRAKVPVSEVASLLGESQRNAGRIRKRAAEKMGMVVAGDGHLVVGGATPDATVNATPDATVNATPRPNGGASLRGGDTTPDATPDATVNATPGATATGLKPNETGGSEAPLLLSTASSVTTDSTLTTVVASRDAVGGGAVDERTAVAGDKSPTPPPVSSREEPSGGVPPPRVLTSGDPSSAPISDGHILLVTYSSDPQAAAPREGRAAAAAAPESESIDWADATAEPSTRILDAVTVRIHAIVFSYHQGPAASLPATFRSYPDGTPEFDQIVANLTRRAEDPTHLDLVEELVADMTRNTFLQGSATWSTDKTIYDLLTLSKLSTARLKGFVDQARKDRARKDKGATRKGKSQSVDPRHNINPERAAEAAKSHLRKFFQK